MLLVQVPVETQLAGRAWKVKLGLETECVRWGLRPRTPLVSVLFRFSLALAFLRRSQCIYTVSLLLNPRTLCITFGIPLKPKHDNMYTFRDSAEAKVAAKLWIKMTLLIQP